MKRRNLNDEGSIRAAILRGMITDRIVLARISTQWSGVGLFGVDWADLVGGWCVKHFKEFGEEPNAAITLIFEKWASETAASDETINSVKEFLTQLDSMDVKHSSDYLVNVAGQHFNKVKTKKEVEAANVAIENGDFETAKQIMQSSRSVDLGSGTCVEPFVDVSIWVDAFADEHYEPLVRYKGAAGVYFAESFLRGEFYAFLAPEKTGKTSHLIDFTYRALRNGNRVAYFEAGDGDDREVVRRLGCRAALLPTTSGTYEFPRLWNDEGEVEYREVDLPRIKDYEAKASASRIIQDPKCWRIESYPSNTLTVQEIYDRLVEWEMIQNWVPDVLVLDYADILAPPKGVREKRDQINDNWLFLRRIAQEFSCLVMTATQASRKAYTKGKSFMGPDHFSESKTKNAHVHGIIGVNVSEEERAKDICRLKWAVNRKSKIKKPMSYVTTAGCFGVDAPILISDWR